MTVMTIEERAESLRRWRELMQHVATKETLPVRAERWRGRKPVLVCVNGRIIADIDVTVSEKDPNSWRNPDFSVLRRVRCQRT